jgi:hypothetical protein
MQKYQVTFRNNRGQVDTAVVTSSTPVSEQIVISQFIARTGYRVICVERVF